MDEKERIFDRENERHNDRIFYEDTGSTEDDRAERSQGELEAQEKMENIFKSVSQNKLEADAATQREPEPQSGTNLQSGANLQDSSDLQDSLSSQGGSDLQENLDSQGKSITKKAPEPKNNQSEIELMTVRRLTPQQKRAIERKKQAAKKRKNRQTAIKFILTLIAVAIVVLGGYCYTDYRPGGQSGEVIVTIPEGAGTAKIAQILKKDGLVNSKAFYRFMSKLRGIDGNYNFGKFKMNKNAGYEDIFKILTQSGVNVDAVKVTIPEGYEIYKIADTLEEKGLIDKDKFYYLVDYGDFDYSFVKDIPQRENRLEGYLFPSTYTFAPGDEYGIIDEMLAQFEKMYDKYRGRAKEMNMSMDETITLASIIEREAIGDEDRKLVSSVFHNRMDSSDYPYLQSCATVQYVLKERKPVLSVEDTKIDSPYNTYINKGLPVGPIASPGEKSIEAALYPEDTDYLFFVLGSDNKHHFSRTYEEHRQNRNN